MDPKNDGVITGAALLLAVAAMLSTPCQVPSVRFDVALWLQLSMGPEADALAGAIAEHPENFISP